MEIFRAAEVTLRNGDTLTLRTADPDPEGDGERLAKRPVETGLRNWDYTEVVEGLEGGERVVVSLDRPEVKAGALVEVQSDSES